MVEEMKSRRKRVEELRDLSKPFQLDPSSSPFRSTMPGTESPVTPTTESPTVTSSFNPNESEPRVSQAKRLLQQLAMKSDRVSYALKELDRHVMNGANLTSGVESELRVFVDGDGEVESEMNGNGNRSRSVSPVVEDGKDREQVVGAASKGGWNWPWKW